MQIQKGIKTKPKKKNKILKWSELFSLKRFDFVRFKLLPKRYEQLRRSKNDVRNILERKFDKMKLQTTNIIHSVVFYEAETIGWFQKNFWDEFFSKEEAEYMCLGFGWY